MFEGMRTREKPLLEAYRWKFLFQFRPEYDFGVALVLCVCVSPRDFNLHMFYDVDGGLPASEGVAGAASLHCSVSAQMVDLLKASGTCG